VSGFLCVSLGWFGLFVNCTNRCPQGDREVLPCHSCPPLGVFFYLVLSSFPLGKLVSRPPAGGEKRVSTSCILGATPTRQFRLAAWPCKLVQRFPSHGLRGVDLPIFRRVPKVQGVFVRAGSVASPLPPSSLNSRSVLRIFGQALLLDRVVATPPGFVRLSHARPLPSSICFLLRWPSMAIVRELFFFREILSYTPWHVLLIFTLQGDCQPVGGFYRFSLRARTSFFFFFC